MIIQIIPANGWYAIYTEKDGSETYEPVVCWALLEVLRELGRERIVVGIDVISRRMSEVTNFVEYVYDPDAHNRVKLASAINSELFK